MYYIEKAPGENVPGHYNIRRWEFADNGGRASICFPHHNHDIFEIISVISGSLKIRCDDREYTLSGGDAAIFNPYEIHYGECSCSTVYLCLTLNLRSITVFSPVLSDFSARILDGRTVFENVYRKGSSIADEISETLSALSGKSPSRTSDVFRGTALLFSLLSMLSESACLKEKEPERRFERGIPALV